MHAGLEEIQPERIDFIHTVNVLEHIHDDNAVVAALRAWPKIGGTLLIYVQAFPLLKVGHVRRYRHGQSTEGLCAAGLQVEPTLYRDCLGFFAALVFKLDLQRQRHVGSPVRWLLTVVTCSR